MKTSKLVCSLAAPLIFTTVFLPAPFLSLAEEKPPSSLPAAGRSRPPGYDLEVVDGSLLYQGQKVPASLSAVVDALRDRYTQANIVLSPGLAKVSVADLKLRAGRLSDELEAVRVACGMQFEVQAPPRPEPGIDPTTGVPAPAQTESNEGLFVLRPAGPRPESERTVEAFNIGPYVAWLSPSMEEKDLGGRHKAAQEKSVNEIAKIIDETVASLREQSDQSGPPTLQFHPGANLLVVVGNIRSVEVARKIVNALPGMPVIPQIDFNTGLPTGGPRGELPDAMMRRYGLTPGSGVPGALQSPAASEDAFRKRYGLPPAANPPNQPGSPPGNSGPQR